MSSVQINGRTVTLGENGYLSDVDDWNEDIGRHLAAAERIEMTDQHWEVVYVLREYYRLYQIAPMIKVLVKKIGQKRGPDKATLRYLHSLYPEGPAKQACKIAGRPGPTGCI